MPSPNLRKEAARRNEPESGRGVDQSRGPALQALCELAADIAKSPAAAILLCGPDGPRVLAKAGVHGDWSTRARLFFTHTTASDGPFVIEDTAREPGLLQSAQRRAGLGFRFYAGMALENAPGICGAMLCVMDGRPRRLRKETLRRLQQVAKAASKILALEEQQRPGALGVRSGSRRSAREGSDDQIRHAIGNGEFVPFYQPTVELKWGRIIGFEVLARWQHPTRGLLSPDDFRPAISDSTITPLLTRAMLNAALKDNASWRASQLSAGRLAINVTSADLLHKHFAAELLKTLERHRFDPKDLVIEVTEGIAMGEPEGQIYKTLSTLRDHGVRVTLDDFGTGFAGLQHLRNWPIDGLKLERQFVGDCLTSKEDQIIVRGIVQMCHDLGLDVVAEGIEDNAQYLFLSNVGCDFGQGYYFSKPVPAGEVPTLLAATPQPQLAQCQRP